MSSGTARPDYRGLETGRPPSSIGAFSANPRTIGAFAQEWPRALKFHLILTLDYELFGNGSGCLQQCVIQPTDRLLEITSRAGGGCTAFVDALEFKAIEEAQGYTSNQTLSALRNQLVELGKAPNAIQLHLHPQWMEAAFDGSAWQLRNDYWRIGDLDADLIDKAVDTGKTWLAQFSSAPITTFRAGGWAIQPSRRTLEVLARHGIKVDSTVAPGAWNPAGGDWYNFLAASNKPWWRIDDDVNVEAPQGDRLEVPIAAGWIGRRAHARVLREQRRQPAFPDGCSGSYAGPNSRFQEATGKLAKLLRLGHSMLDFSRLPGWALIELTQRYMSRFEDAPGPVPIVAIAHNKNFSEWSGENLMQWLEWVAGVGNIGFSDFDAWRTAAISGDSVARELAH